MEAFTEKLHALTVHLLAEADIEVAATEARTKSVDSFIGKIQRPDKNYTDPLAELTDLCGIRIITHYLEDVERVGDLIRGTLVVDPKRSVDKSEIMDPDRFGYQSVHYIVSLDETRRTLAEWERFGDLTAELQVRTVLQHAWAAIDHKLRYKAMRDVPRPLRRDLFRLSALFELGDLEFSRLRENMAAQFSEYVESVREGELDIAIDRDSLRAYLAAHPVHSRLAELARSKGFRAINLPLDPQAEEHGQEALLSILFQLEVRSLRELQEAVEASSSSAGDVLSYVNTASRAVGYKPVANPYDALIIVLLHQRRSSIAPELVHSLAYPVELAEAIVLGLLSVG